MTEPISGGLLRLLIALAALEAILLLGLMYWIWR
jgi:hypothetical protein